MKLIKDLDQKLFKANKQKYHEHEKILKLKIKKI